MSLEARKIEFIQEFLKLQSDEVISKFEKILIKEKSHSDKIKMEPMSIQELNTRIDKSMEDSKNGKLTAASVTTSLESVITSYDCVTVS